MKAFALEFRFRYLIHIIVLGLGLFAPWNYFIHADPTGANAHVWGILAAWLSEQHVMSIGAAFEFLLSVGIVFAVAAAVLRTWGTAYLGAGTVEGGTMQASVVADGPYRFLRNPLYLGTMLHAVALAMLMPRSGAIFSLIVIAILQVRLILGEEYFLIAKLGPPYQAYCQLVPRILPALRPRVAGSGKHPQWLQAFLVEIYMWGVAGSYAFAGWDFNAPLLLQCTLVSMGVGLVVRALKPTQTSQPQAV